MPEGSIRAALLAGFICLGVDLLFLRRRPRNIAVAFVQFTFTATVVGAAWLSEAPGALIVILLLAMITKIVVQRLYWRTLPTLTALAGTSGDSHAPFLYGLLGAGLLGCYGLLVLSGGFAWFQSIELRRDYIAENSVPLRAVRHWTPLMLLWGLQLLKQPADERTQSGRHRAGVLIGPFLLVQFVAYALLEGSKGAAVIIVVISAGAFQILGYRISKRFAAPIALGAVVLLFYFLSKVANEWATSVPEAFLLRMVSGSEGLLRAVEPPDGINCELSTFWFPITNFVSKLLLQGATPGFNSMGHCLAAADPDYPWELLVPLFAGAYHATPWAVPAFLVGFLVLSKVGIGITWRICHGAGVEELAFPACYFLFFHLMAVATDGKPANFLVSPFTSVLVFVMLAAALKRMLALVTAGRVMPPAGEAGVPK